MRGRARAAMTSIFGLAIGLGVAALPDLAQAADLTLRFNDGDVSEMEAALAQFESENPDISVTLERIAWKDAQAQFLREAAVGQGPDLVHIAFVWTRDMGDAEALLPLDDMIAADAPGSGFDDFIATDLVYGSDGKIYGLPWTTDTWAMVYRTDVLAEAGIDAFPESWDGLVETSKAVHDKTGKTGFALPAGSGGNNTIWFLANYYWWSHGKALIEDDGAGGFRIGLEKGDIVEMLDYYARFFDEAGLSASFHGISQEFDPAIIEGLISGDVAIGIMPPATAKQVMASWAERNPGAESPFASATIPTGPAGSVTHLGGRTLGINAATEEPEAAWKLMKFLTSKELFENYYTSQFPAQKSLLDAIDFGPALGGYAKQLAGSRTWGAYATSPAQIGSLWNEAGRLFSEALSGQTDHESAAEAYLDYAAKQLEG